MVSIQWSLQIWNYENDQFELNWLYQLSSQDYFHCLLCCCVVFVVQSISHVQLLTVPWIAAHQASLQRRQWQSSPGILPGESQGRGSLVGCCLWGGTESATTEATQQQQQQQASLTFPIMWNLFRFIATELVMPSNHLILCHPLLLLLRIFPNIRVFFNQSVLGIRCQSTGASASASVLPMNNQDWFCLGLNGLIALQPKGLWRVFSNTTIRKHQFFGTQPSLCSNPHICIWLLEKL